MKIGVVRDGRVLSQTSVPAKSKSGLRPRLPVLKSTWLRLLGDLSLDAGNCAGISVGFPSLVDVSTGRILAHYGKYKDALDFDFREWAAKEFGLPLAIENDARLALAGEWKYGAGRGSDNVVMITLGTGLGTSAVIKGRVLRGCHGQAGVLGGHLTVRYGGRYCTCGNAGCAEAEASTAFLGYLAAGMNEYDASPLSNLATLNYAAVFKQAAAGDPCAEQLRDHSLQVWAALAVNLIHAYDPEILILGGGIMGSAGTILPTIRQYVLRNAHTPWGKVSVVAGELGEAAALMAGEWLLSEQHPDEIKLR
jgi:glucokinase